MKKTVISLLIACMCVVLCACSSNGKIDNLGSSEGIVTDQNDLDPSEEIEVPEWHHAYLEVICNMKEYLVDINDFRSDHPELYDPMNTWVFLGIHDFNGDEIPELLVGDLLTMAVFTFTDGKTEKIADLYDEYDPITWCINGVHYKDNSVSLGCAGAGGTTYVNFGYLDGQYVLGTYSELSLPSVVRINGEESTLEEMNRIYTINYAERGKEELREQIRLVNENGIWKLRFESGKEAVLDDQFDFELIQWE